MKLLLKFHNHSDARPYLNLEAVASDFLDGNDYDRGHLEAIAHQAENNSKAIGRLLDLLVEKNLITLQDCVPVLLDRGNATITRG